LGREYLRRYIRLRRRPRTAIKFLGAMRLDALPFSADSTMSIGWRISLREFV
jgi:hypothetical protein